MAYWAASLQLGRLLSGDAEPGASLGLLLHRKWFQSLLRVLSLPAATVEGEPSKSVILRMRSNSHWVSMSTRVLALSNSVHCFGPSCDREGLSWLGG